MLHAVLSPGGPYSSTVMLPVTNFNLRANSVVREPQIQAFWAEQRVYEALVESNAGVGVCGDFSELVGVLGVVRFLSSLVFGQSSMCTRPLWRSTQNKKFIKIFLSSFAFWAC